MMDNIASKDGHFDADLEKGIVSGEGDSRGNHLFGNYAMKQLYSEASSDGGLGTSNRTVHSDERAIASVASCCSDGSGYVKLVVVDKKVGEERRGDVEEKSVKEKPKTMSAKKPPKPPRPPRGLSLDSADQKLIRELHELAKLKRARVERMKALKKAKEAKAASSKNQLFATLLTLLFCIVLLVQGISSRTNSAVNFQGSPTSSGVTEGSIISVQPYPIPSTTHINKPDSESPRQVERVSGLDTPEQVSRAAG